MSDIPSDANKESKNDRFPCPGDECRRQVYRLAYHLLGKHEDAEDACQEICARCWRHRGKFRGDAARTTWLYRVTVNVCKSKKKRQACPYLLFADLAEEQAEMLEAWMDERGTGSGDWLSDGVPRVKRALEQISLPYRQLLEWRYEEDLSPAEIAQRLGCSVGSVWGRLHRARKALQRAYAALDEEDL